MVVPRGCIYDLWEAFNDIAEGFGLTIDEFQEIIKSAVMEYLSVTERQLNTSTDVVFRLFDSDEVRLRVFLVTIINWRGSNSFTELICNLMTYYCIRIIWLIRSNFFLPLQCSRV